MNLGNEGLDNEKISQEEETALFSELKKSKQQLLEAIIKEIGLANLSSYLSIILKTRQKHRFSRLFYGLENSAAQKKLETLISQASQQEVDSSSWIKELNDSSPKLLELVLKLTDSRILTTLLVQSALDSYKTNKQAIAARFHTYGMKSVSLYDSTLKNQLPKKDLPTAVQEAISEACLSFDSEKNCRFIMLLAVYIKSSAQRIIAANSGTKRHMYYRPNKTPDQLAFFSPESLDAPTEEDGKRSPHDLIPDEDGVCPYKELESECLKQLLEKILSAMEKQKNGSRMADIIKRRFALSPYEEEWTLKEIAQVYNISHQRVNQILQKGLEKLETELKELGIESSTDAFS